MEDLIATWGLRVLVWLVAVLTAVMTWLVWSRMGAGKLRDLLQRAWLEVLDACREVFQTYVETLKEGKDPASPEGASLTHAEKAEAKRRAIAIFKANFGTKGLRRLAKIFGLDLERWIGSKIESAVNVLKVEGAAAGKSASSPTPVVPLPLP